MRKFLTPILLTALVPVANAHTLAAEDGAPAQLAHQFLGMHHFPITALILVGGILAFRAWYKKST